MAYALVDLGAMYLQMEILDSASVYLNLGENYVQALNYAPLNFLYLRSKTSLLFASEENYNLGLALSFKMQSLANVSRRPIDKCQAHLQTSKAYHGLGNFTPALLFLDSAVALAKSNHFLSELSEAYFLKSSVLESQGHSAEALDNFKLFNAYSDTILNQDKHKQVQELMFLFETEKKDRQLLEQKLAITDREQKLERRKYWIFGIVGLAIFLAIFGATQVNRIRLKRKAHEQELKLFEQEKLMNLQVAKEEAEEQERSRIAGELHDGVAGMLAGIKFHVQSVFTQHKVEPQKAKEVLEYLTDASTEVRSLSHKLGSTMVKELGLCKALEKFTSPLSEKHKILLDCKIDGGVLFAREQLLFRISQEMILNAYKHAEADRIDVEVRVNKDSWLISVQDNGKGISENANGFGMDSLRSRVMQLNGKLEILRPENGGTHLIAKGTHD